MIASVAAVSRTRSLCTMRRTLRTSDREPIRPIARPFETSRGRCRKVRSNHEHVGFGVFRKQLVARTPALPPIVVGAAAPIRARDLAWMVDAVAGDQRFFAFRCD